MAGLLRTHGDRRGPGIQRTLFGVLMVAVAAVGCGATGRVGRGPIDEAPPPPPPPPTTRAPAPTIDDQNSPQAAAASALIAQARQLYQSGRLDAALSRLERAASVNPRDGVGHYWLAEVWWAKGNGDQAAEHHRLARRYLAGRDDWSGRLQKQRVTVESQR